jgi:outer membrane lipopolysaccharide assembly protein LptE/RlpB
MKSIIVNHLVLISLFFILIFSNCGFQLNRNRVVLKNGATSLYIQRITNSSYSPALDVKVKRELEILLNTQKIELISKKQADLVINIELLNLSIVKSKYALDPDTNVQSYEFRFQLVGKMNLIENKSINQVQNIPSESLFENVTLKVTNDLISTNQDLTTEETETGNEDVVTFFAKKILDELTDAF